PTAAIVAIFAFQVVVIVSLGFIVWLWVLSVYPVSDMASFSLLTPLFGVLFGFLIFGEALTPSFLTAIAAVCAGLYLVNRRPRGRSGAAR
ncbi:MAG: EamA family transporter, partial [Gammaproteobacteria bacterium]